MKHYKYMLNADYLVIDIETDEISMADRDFDNKLLSDDMDYETEMYDIPDPWFRSFFDNIYECT